MNLSTGLMHVQLDESYTVLPETAQQHVEDTLTQFKCEYRFVQPPARYTGLIPPLPADWDVMACPRVISEQASRIGLGHIGPRVRALAKQAPFPILIPSMTYKPWNSVTAFFGGSQLGATAVKYAMAIARLANVPLRVHTQFVGITESECKDALAKTGALHNAALADVEWRTYAKGSFEENLYEVDHDSLIVAGAAGHHIIKELVFGSKLEIIQSVLPNSLVVVGPECSIEESPLVAR
jgi:hypothetical protein